MSSRRVRLGDVTTKIGSGATPRGGKGVYVASGTAFIRSQNVHDNRFAREGLAFINDDAAHALRGVTVETGDVLINITGESVTRTCLVDPDVLPARVSQHVAIVRPDATMLDSAYLKAVLLSPDVKAHLNLLSSGGATRRALTKAHLANLEISLPSLDEQRRIAGMLRTLDRLIEHNADSIAHLDALGRTVVEARSKGATWGTHSLGDIVSEIETGRRPRGGVSGISDGTPSVGAESIVSLGVWNFTKTKFVPTDFAETMRTGRVESGDVLIYKDGGKPGDFRPKTSMAGDGFPFDHCVLNEHVFRVRCEPPVTQGFLYFWLQQPGTVEEMRNLGTGAAIPGLNRTALKSVAVRVPEGIEGRALMRDLDTLAHSALALAAENKNLTQTRDALLPLLISGRIRVKDLEGVGV